MNFNMGNLFQLLYIGSLFVFPSEAQHTKLTISAKIEINSAPGENNIATNSLSYVVSLLLHKDTDTSSQSWSHETGNTLNIPFLDPLFFDSLPYIFEIFQLEDNNPVDFGGKSKNSGRYDGNPSIALPELLSKVNSFSPAMSPIVSLLLKPESSKSEEVFNSPRKPLLLKVPSNFKGSDIIYPSKVSSEEVKYDQTLPVHSRATPLSSKSLPSSLSPRQLPLPDQSSDEFDLPTVNIHSSPLEQLQKTHQTEGPKKKRDVSQEMEEDVTMSSVVLSVTDTTETSPTEDPKADNVTTPSGPTPAVKGRASLNSLNLSTMIVNYLIISLVITVFQF